MTYPRSREGAAPMTMPLEDVALSEKVSVFHAPRAGDLALLGVLAAVLLGNGAWLWRQMGVNSEAGRAVFFGMLLLCVYWAAIVYIFKLSLAVCVSPRGVSVVRGPWSVEIRWSELTRLMERMQPLDGRRYRWVVAIARDGRRISVREDAIGDYARFRREAYERYRAWRDHGGTWGATGSGPFTAAEMVRDDVRWWAFAAVMLALPGVYFATLLPATNPLGYALLVVALLCVVALVQAFLQRQTYTIDQRAVESRSMLKRTRLTWGEVTKVERTRHPVGGIILSGVAVGRLALRMASRGDTGIRTFAWSPRVPEYLTLRGGGRHARIRLHRLNQPDELLAWVEFYDQVRGSASGQRQRPQSAPRSGPISRPQATPTSGPISRPLSASETFMPDMSAPSGPLDPWGSGRQGEPEAASQPFTAPSPARHFTKPNLPDLDSDPREQSYDDGMRFVDPDNPSVSSIQTFGASEEDAWLRETSALNRVEGGLDGANAAEPVEYTPPPPPAPEPAPEQTPWRYQTQQPHQAQRPQTSGPRPQTPAPRHDSWHAEPAPVSAPVPMPAPLTPQRPAEDAMWDDAEAHDDTEWNDDEPETSEMEAPEPWRDANWQRPQLPRFGPKRDETPDQQ